MGRSYISLTENFIANAVPHRPLLLLLDDHSTHFESKPLQVAKDNSIVIFCLPLQTTNICSHAKPALECNLFKPLRKQWRQECHIFYQNKLVISKYNFCDIL